MLSIVTKEAHAEIEKKNICLYKCTRDINRSTDNERHLS